MIRAELFATMQHIMTGAVPVLAASRPNFTDWKYSAIFGSEDAACF